MNRWYQLLVEERVARRRAEHRMVMGEVLRWVWAIYGLAAGIFIGLGWRELARLVRYFVGW